MTELISQDYIKELNDIDLGDYLNRIGKPVPSRDKKSIMISCVSSGHANDKSPSMSINTTTGQFHCFGCGCSGAGAISFHAAVRGLSSKDNFIELVESLSAMYGKEIVYSNTEKGHLTRDIEIRNALFGLVQLSLKPPYFPDERDAFLNFAKEREFSNEDRDVGKLGYLPRNFASSPYAKKHESELIEAGILKISDSGKIYCPFARRLIIPIMDEKGRVVAIAGRKFLEDDQSKGKYRNSDETVIFKKSNILFGLHTAIKSVGAGEMLDSINVVEGYLDAISAQTRGFPNTVASMGTALTNSHLKLLRRKTNTVNFIFDPDNAGYEASARAMLNALPFSDDMNINIVLLPVDDSGNKYDPDEILKKFGPDYFAQILETNKKTIFEFAAEYIAGRNNTTIKEMLDSGMIARGNEVFNSLPSGLSRQIISIAIAQEMSKKFGLSFNPEHIGMQISSDIENAEIKEQLQEAERKLAEATRTIERLNQRLDSAVANNKAQNPAANAQTPLATHNSSEPPIYESIPVGDPDGPAPSYSQATQSRGTPKAPPIKNKTENREGVTMSVGNAVAIPFSMASFAKSNDITANDWVLTNSGTFAQVTEVTPTGFNAQSSVERASLSINRGECLKIMPEKVIQSKRHTSDVRVLLINGKWLENLPAEHFHLANKIISAEKKDPASFRQALEEAAYQSLSPDEANPSVLTESINKIRKMDIDALKARLSWNASQANSLSSGANKLDGLQPSTFLMDRPLATGDLVTKKNSNGEVFEVVSVNGQMMLKDTASQKTSFVSAASRDYFVLKTSAKTQSKIASDIACIGQVIFKLSEGGKWMSKLPSEWVASKEQQKEIDNSPSP